MPSFPSAWEELLWQAVRAEVGAAATELAVLVPAIFDRTRRYTDERHRLGEILRGVAADRDLAARALFFTVADAAKIAVPIAELESRALLPHRPLRVLDAGAGVGAMTLGLLASLPGRALDIVAVDRDARALALLARVAAPHVRSITIHAADVTRSLPDGPFDLVVAGTVVNELPAPARAPFVRALLDRLAPDGSVILVEPALRDTSRALHALRDELIASGQAHVFAPCTHESSCPALVDPRDWCHEDRSFQPPPRLAALMTRTGLRDGGLKFSYLTLRHAPDPLVPGADAANGATAVRVVSGALDSKGVVERIVCGVDGRRHLRILRRDRSPELTALHRSQRGDVLVVAAASPASSRDRPTET